MEFEKSSEDLIIDALKYMYRVMESVTEKSVFDKDKTQNEIRYMKKQRFFVTKEWIEKIIQRLKIRNLDSPRVNFYLRKLDDLIQKQFIEIY